MATLLSTLGTSWAVVPEAFLLGNGQAGYERVFVLTTSSNATLAAKAKTEQWFASHAPQTSLRVLAIEHMQDLSSEIEHQRFEEALYQVYFHLLQDDSDIHVCLAGGFKTMSASAQEAAGLLGCSQLFHLLADPIASVGSDGSPGSKFPDSHEEIRSAIANNQVRLIDLGSRAGWPTIRELAAEAPALPPAGAPFLVEDHSLQNKVHHRLEAGMRLAASERELAALPFPQLARWAPGERDALQAPLDPNPKGPDHAWILALPKVELHCHLGGFATHGESLRQVREAADFPERLAPLVEPALPPGWPIPTKPIGLEAYRMLGNANGSQLLKDPGCLVRQIELLYRHFQEQNIIHAEVRCSPANYTSHGRSAWDVLADIRETFERCRQQATAAGERAPLVNLINIGISGASLGDNLLLLPSLCPGLTRLDVLRMLRNAIDQAFLPPAKKAGLLGCQLPRSCEGKSCEQSEKT